eukprot:gnl/Ergobibamus_cyprinoides/2305.p1 GENE.gnl/Ergobibamus_cyprinoides/2305~~gnl/Ergobibamus_cyprinoides/2305.p1  ORF type:complete len:141 (+),score=36.64 gnl/Ergobibamus_cyprinoides/2305:547-969(+)
MLAAQVHIGTKNCDARMASYVFGRRPDGIHVIDMDKTWQKIVLAARMIAAIENPADIAVVCSRPYGQRATLEVTCRYIGATRPLAGRLRPSVPSTNRHQPPPFYGGPPMIILQRTPARGRRQAGPFVVCLPLTNPVRRFV